MYLVRDLVLPRTWLAFIHHFIGVLVGAVVVWIVVPGLVVGTLGLPVALIGMPILGTTLRFTDWFARAERARFAVTLGERIPVWPAGTRSGYRLRLLPRLAKLSEGATWREVSYAVLRGPASAAAASLASAPLSSESAWGAIVVTALRGQLVLVSGRSNASKNG